MILPLRRRNAELPPSRHGSVQLFGDPLIARHNHGLLYKSWGPVVEHHTAPVCMETWRVVDNVASISFEILRAYHSKYHSIKCIKIVYSTHNNPQLFSLSSWALNFPPFPHDVVSMLKRTSKVPPFPTLTYFHCLNGHRIHRHFSCVEAWVRTQR
jgi:hypothetical protein